jgi:hypothetical protein
MKLRIMLMFAAVASFTAATAAFAGGKVAISDMTLVQESGSIATLADGGFDHHGGQHGGHHGGGHHGGHHGGGHHGGHHGAPVNTQNASLPTPNVALQ